MSLHLQNALSSVHSVICEVPEALANVRRQIEESCLKDIFANVVSSCECIAARISEIGAGASRLGSVVVTEISTVIKRCRGQDVSDELLTVLGLRNTPNKEAYFQVLAQQGVYITYPDGYRFPPSDHFTCPNYQLKKTIQYPEGIKIMVLTTDDLQEAPLMVIRGTEFSNILNVMDVLQANIGLLNTEQYKNVLESELKALVIEYGRVHIMGHSYGGAVAQRLTSKYPEHISRCTRYNAPGVGDEVVETYTHNIARLPKNCSRPEIVSHRHARDIASLLGGASLPTDQGRDYTAGSVDDRISHIEAHSFNTLSTGAFHANSDDSHRHYCTASLLLEDYRKRLGRFIMEVEQYYNRHFV